MANYDPNVDYQALIEQAEGKGDYQSAARYEQLRNQKIEDLNAAGGGTNPYGATKSNKYSQYLNDGNSTNDSGTYVSINDYIYGDYGTGSSYDKKTAESEKLKAYYSQNPDAAVAMTREEMELLAEQYGITGSFDEYYGYLSSPTPGTSQADEYLLSNGAYELTRAISTEWKNLEGQRKAALDAGNTALAEQIAAQQKQLNNTNNRIKLAFGYSGGTDGSAYFTKGELGLTDRPNTNPGNFNGVLGGGNPGGSAGSGIGSGEWMETVPGGSGAASGGQNDLREMLKLWRQAAMSQNGGKIDYAVQKAVIDLERALQDAQPMFREQAESVARDERQALDNSALYAEMRGDKGGIGKEQYNAIQNTAARNRLAVQQAQTKLASDTARQIADLRLQGEFEKADAALELTQTYLSQLVKLEQWAAEFQLSEAEFHDAVARWKAEYALDQQKLQLGYSQWQKEYELDQQKLQLGYNQWQQEYALDQEKLQLGQLQWQQEFTASQNDRLASMGEALLRAGVMPTEAQLAAMGITAQQADSYLILRQLETVR